MSKTRLMFDYENPILPVPVSFIDQYMTDPPAIYSLIYLFGLRRAVAGEGTSPADVAAHFNILETDVHNAWRHWADAGLISIEGCETEQVVTFLPPEKWGSGSTAPEKTKKIVPAATSFAERPHYNVDELNLFRQKSKEVEQLFACAERELGKLLTYHDMNVLFGFYDWLRLPVDVLEFLLTYCAEKDHRDLRYIEKCALDWADKGMTTLEKARSYVQTFDGDYRAVLQAMGANAAFPTPTQRKYIDKWRGEWTLPNDLILEAIDRAAVQIGKPKFTYVDKILAAWHKAGIITVEAAQVAGEEFSKTREAAIAPLKTAKPKQSRFANFTQRKNDYAHLEKLQREYMLREAKAE